MNRNKWMAVAFTVALWRSIALGGIGDPAAGHLYTVPGVLHTTYLATVFHCTNSSPSGSSAVMMTGE